VISGTRLKNLSEKPIKTDSPVSSSQTTAEAPKTTQAEALIYAQTSLHTGPLPSPELFARYGEVLPEAPERILKMAENEQGHRHNIEKWIVRGDTIRSYLGVICAFAIVIYTLYLGTNLIYAGHVWQGSIFAGTGLVALAAAFIYGTRAQKEAQEHKKDSP
jgi:uncharacterized membrane protein